MSLDDFKQQYAAGGTAIECVRSSPTRARDATLTLPPPGPPSQQGKDQLLGSERGGARRADLHLLRGGGFGGHQDDAKVRQALAHHARCDADLLQQRNRFIDILESQKIPRGILIYKTSMTPSANKVRHMLRYPRRASLGLTISATGHYGHGAAVHD